MKSHVHAYPAVIVSVLIPVDIKHVLNDVINLEADEIRVYQVPKETSARVDTSPISSGAAPNTKLTGTKFTVQEGWKTGKAGGMRKAAYTVTQDDQQAEITGIDLPLAAADRLNNVNRWRGQLKLGPTTAAELEDQLEAIEVDGLPGHYVEIAGAEDASPRDMILGAMVKGSDRVWFFKLRGAHSLAEQERERFKAFVRSSKIGSSESNPDG